jgi:folate-binding protein YgfZ
MNEPLVATQLRLTGRDALPLLHRISTQALLDLKPGETRATLFCDFRGRLLHRALVAVAEDGALTLTRWDAPGAELAKFLDRHIFRDDVAIEDRSGGAVPERSGAQERARIRAGEARHGHEILEAFNPYEVGLAADVHLDKGCYTGQEALQRLITYGSVRRELTRVSGAGNPPAVPADITRAGETVGVLTSAAADEPGGWIGLAVIKKDLVSDTTHDLDVVGSGITLQPLPAACPAGLPTSSR